MTDTYNLAKHFYKIKKMAVVVLVSIGDRVIMLYRCIKLFIGTLHDPSRKSYPKETRPKLGVH